MNTIGNILWFLLGGVVIALIYFVIGFIFLITIIGIPFGRQLFKMGGFALWPFGREVVETSRFGGCLTVGMNILWVLVGWWEIALVHITFGILCAITIVGIPFAKQHFKMAYLALLPFGREFH